MEETSRTTKCMASVNMPISQERCMKGNTVKERNGVLANTLVETGSSFMMGENNKMHGKGIRCYQDESVFEGRFLENTRHGLGKIEFKSENVVYQGDWRNNAMHGQGLVNVEKCDSVIVNKRWWERNPLLSHKVKDVNVTFHEGLITESFSVRRRRRVFRLSKNQYRVADHK